MSPHWLSCAFAALVVLASSQPAAAQIPSSELPGRAREQFQQPRVPLSQPGAARIALPSTVAPPGAENLKVLVRGVRITGGTIYSPEDLAPLYQDLIGHDVPLTAIYDLAQRITAKYGSDGYVLSRAVVPPQELSPHGAVVHIQIIEGYIDRVEWPPALSKYRDFFSQYAAKITAERPINVKTLERYLLLAGDLPGLKFTNSLKASPTNPGAATLVVEVVEKPIDLLARVDNRGTEARGPYQYFTSINVNNLARMHESWTLSTAGAFQLTELQYYLASYRQVLTSEGLTVFFNDTYTRSRPGTETLRLLEYKTRGDLFEAGVLYPFIRSREKNLIATALFFMSNDRSADARRRPQDSRRQRQAARAVEHVRRRAGRSGAGDRDGDATLGGSAGITADGDGSCAALRSARLSIYGVYSSIAIVRQSLADVRLASIAAEYQTFQHAAINVIADATPMTESKTTGNHSVACNPVHVNMPATVAFSRHTHRE